MGKGGHIKQILFENTMILTCMLNMENKYLKTNKILHRLDIATAKFIFKIQILKTKKNNTF